MDSANHIAGDWKQNGLPRWRGFNLVNMFNLVRFDGRFVEDDFKWIAEWGFNFVRIPMSYLWWVKDEDRRSVDEAKLDKVDRAVELGQKYRLHVCLNFHRAPGYCINAGNPGCKDELAEPFNLWRDSEAQEAFGNHWRVFAERYRGVSSDRLSFNLINEPPAPWEIWPDDQVKIDWKDRGMRWSDHAQVIRSAVKAIREADPGRLIIIDGVSGGRQPCMDMIDLGVAQSCRAYFPIGVTHFKASWAGDKKSTVLPSWPDFPDPNLELWDGKLEGNKVWNRDTLDLYYQPWSRLAAKGIGVHCGEGGCLNHTPHKVALGWLRDVLDVLKSHNVGYAIWNFRGGFGILNSSRQDVAYEDWHGDKLDRRMLELLQAF